MASFSGDLSSISLMDLIQMTCLGRKSCTLIVSGPAARGIVVIYEGEVIHCQHPPHKGERALVELLRLKKGRFEMDEEAPTLQRTISKGWQNLLMDCAVLIDENTTHDSPEEFGVEESLKVTADGRPSELDPALRNTPGLLMAVELGADDVVLDRTGLGDPEAAVRMKNFLEPVAAQLGETFGFGKSLAVAYKGPRTMYIQTSLETSHVCAFFDPTAGASRIYRGFEKNLMNMLDKRSQA